MQVAQLTELLDTIEASQLSILGRKVDQLLPRRQPSKIGSLHVVQQQPANLTAPRIGLQILRPRVDDQMPLYLVHERVHAASPPPIGSYGTLPQPIPRAGR
jgi:hypothetical protein